MKTTTIKDRLKQIMDKRNLRQSDVVRICEPYCQKYDVKIGRSDICQYLSGTIEPKNDKVFVLAQALVVDPIWLMGLSDVDALNLTEEEEQKVRYGRYAGVVEKAENKGIAPVTLESIMPEDENEDSDLIFLIQTVKKMPHNKRTKIIDIIRVVYSEYFD